MAANVYVKFEGPSLPGTGTGEHASEIEVNHWGWEISPPSRRDDRSPSELQISKYLDAASTHIMRACWSAQQFAKATLRLYRQNGIGDVRPVEYLRVAMERVTIANVAVNGGPGDVPTETLTLDYGSIRYIYIEQRGASAPVMQAVGMDVETGKVE